MSRYPQYTGRHTRILCIRGVPRGVSVSPKFGEVPPPEMVHHQSTIIPLPHTADQVMVIEWTGDRRELHLADV
jgi:hypothetical protein